MPFSAIKGSCANPPSGSASGRIDALHSTKGGAPYRGDGGLHGANHNDVEDNSVTISKDEMFSFWEKMLIDQRNPEPYPYLRKPAETTFYPARKDGWAFYYAFCRHAAL